MAPQWYFTSEAVSNYMPMVVRKKWDMHDIGIKLEAFAIAGCDRISEFNLSPLPHLSYLIDIRSMHNGKKTGRIYQDTNPRSYCHYAW